MTVQRKCFPAKWLVIFNLYKKIGNEFVQIVGIEFEAEKKEEKKAIEEISKSCLGDRSRGNRFMRSIPRITGERKPGFPANFSEPVLSLLNSNWGN